MMEEQDDRLSNLPEPLLSTILSLIPTKQAAATSILSRRWRYVWRSVTRLHLLHHLPTSDDDSRSDTQIWDSMMGCVERSVQGPVHACRISFNPSSCRSLGSYALRLNTFIHSLVRKGIKELALVNQGAGCYELPSQAFFCHTLEKLELGSCMLSVVPPPSSPSPFCASNNIKSLVLYRVHFTNDQFREMISCCKLLESLKVDCCVKVRHLSISAPKLSSLEIVTLKRIRISLAGIANLKQASFRFLLALENTCIPYCNDSSREEDGDQADKLIQLLIHLSQCNLERLSLHFCPVFSECLQWQGADVAYSLPPQYHLHALKKLNLAVSLSNLQVATVLSCLLRSCPNLSELVIQDKEQSDTIGSFWDSHCPSQSMLNCLRIIRIHGVNLNRSYWTGFVKFLLMNACACERITIHYFHDPWKKTVQEQKFSSFQWASPHAVLELKPLS